LVAATKQHKPGDFKNGYSELFMNGLKVKTTVKKNVNVLQHIMGYLKKELAPAEKRDILNVIEDYHMGMVPLIVPVTLVKHYVNKFDVSYVKEQVYLSPHPKELMLRNHV
jgi:uncharacterized protein YbgA (DUF1722 family)